MANFKLTLFAIISFLVLFIFSCTQTQERTNFKAESHAQFYKWNDWYDRFENSPPLKSFTNLDENNLQDIQMVNIFVNNLLTYTPENNDYWQTHTETLMSLQGDCEDYALLKYAFLKYAGFNEDNMYLFVVFDTVAEDIHAVLVVTLNGESYVLDNQSKYASKLKDVKQYTSIYRINKNEVYLVQ